MKKRNVVKDVEKEILNQILNDCDFNLFEKIVVRVFYKEFIKVYNVERIKWMNHFLS